MHSFRGKNIIDLEIDNVCSWDYPDFADAYISYARWADTGEPLTDDELNALNQESGDIVYQLALESFH
jgi:hypothetical protein